MEVYRLKTSKIFVYVEQGGKKEIEIMLGDEILDTDILFFENNSCSCLTNMLKYKDSVVFTASDFSADKAFENAEGRIASEIEYTKTLYLGLKTDEEKASGKPVTDFMIKNASNVDVFDWDNRPWNRVEVVFRVSKK